MTLPPCHLTIGRTKKLIVATVVVFSMACAAQMAPSHEPMKSTQQASPHGQMTATQSGNPHSQWTGSSALKAFGTACGLTEMSEKNVQLFGWNPKAWKMLRPQDVGEVVTIAKAWTDAEGHVRVVDISESLNETGDALRVSHLCYSPKGSIRKVSENYVNIPQCACGRRAEIAFDEQGKQTKSQLEFYKMPSQEKIAADKAPKGFPGVSLYHSIGQLPFANLLKGKNASSH